MVAPKADAAAVTLPPKVRPTELKLLEAKIYQVPVELVPAVGRILNFTTVPAGTF
jgi:hypothetical protein